MTSAVIARQWIALRLEQKDSSLIRRFYWRQSPDTTYRRFMGPVSPRETFSFESGDVEADIPLRDQA
jgi:hypothetical protein